MTPNERRPAGEAGRKSELATTGPSVAQAVLSEPELRARWRRIQAEIEKLREWCRREGVPWEPEQREGHI